jgi:tight adherence protein B
MSLLIAALVFVALFTLIAGSGWVVDSERRMHDRLRVHEDEQGEDAGVIRAERRAWQRLANGWLVRMPLHGRVSLLTAQAGYADTVVEWLAVVAAAAALGAVAGWLRAGASAALIGAALFGAAPVAYLCWKRHGRLRSFEQQLPDSLGMMTRALRAGSALSGAIKLVGEEMPDPAGAEFRRASEEIRLGLDPADSLVRLQQRVPTDDLRFFCTAVSIQRGAGGNLAEILERLAEVIRERFKLLSYARVLSSQHRWSAILVGLSPVIFALILHFMSPGYFDPLFKSRLGPLLIQAGVVLETLGFLTIWRLSRIEV